MARFFRRGVSKVYFLPSMANKAAPSAGEISAGTDLTGAIADIGGFTYTNSPIDTPDLGSTYTTTIPGEDTTDTPSLTFYDDNASTAIRTALAKGVTGYILRAPYGSGTGKRAETWPVTSTGVNDTWSAGNDAAQFVTQFAVTAVPTMAAVLP